MYMYIELLPVGGDGLVYTLLVGTVSSSSSLFSSSALVWGASVKHQPQKVGKDHTLQDEDVVQIVKK